MSKAKRQQQQSESFVPPKMHIDPMYMMAIRSGGGRVHLIDRNCALVSRRCRRFLESMEEAVLQYTSDREVAAATEELFSPRTEPETLSVAFYGVRGGKGTEQGTAAAGGGSCCGPEEEVIVHVPLPMLFTIYRERIAAHTAAPLDVPSRQDAPRVSSSNAHHRGTIAGAPGSANGSRATPASTPSPSWVPAFASFMHADVCKDVRLYPLVDVPEICDDTMDLAIGYMYHKYRADTDTNEKRQSEALAPVTTFGHNPSQLIAAATILQI